MRISLRAARASWWHAPAALPLVAPPCRQPAAVGPGAHRAWTARSFAIPLVLALFASCLFEQVVARPAVGLANNGDFPRMAGPFGLGPAEGNWESHVQYGEFVYRYIRSDSYRYNRGFRDAHFLSSEFFLVKIARGLQRILRPGPLFDIRWLGCVGGVLLLFAAALWISALPLPWRIPGGVLLVLVWTDVACVQYFNSFYMDSAAFLFLVIAFAGGLRVANGAEHWFPALLMICAATLFATSKSQHAPPGLLFLPLFAAFAFRSRHSVARYSWIAGSLLLVLGTYIVLDRDTALWRSYAVFNVVFEQLTPDSPDQLRTLQELGLGKAEQRLIGTHAFYPDSPLLDPAWAANFMARCNYRTLLRYYLRHPALTGAMLYRNLATSASRIRPWGNRSLEDGFKPRAQAASFTYWSDFRSFLLKKAPWHIILLAFIICGSALLLLFLSPAHWRLAALVLMIQTMAALEYSVAILADGVETDRHLFLFHASTDISILVLPCVIWAVYARLKLRDMCSNDPYADLAAPGTVRLALHSGRAGCGLAPVADRNSVDGAAFRYAGWAIPSLWRRYPQGRRTAP